MSQPSTIRTAQTIYPTPITGPARPTTPARKTGTLGSGKRLTRNFDSKKPDASSQLPVPQFLLTESVVHINSIPASNSDTENSNMEQKQEQAPRLRRKLSKLSKRVSAPPAQLNRHRVVSDSDETKYTISKSRLSLAEHTFQRSTSNPFPEPVPSLQQNFSRPILSTSSSSASSSTHSGQTQTPRTSTSTLPPNRTETRLSFFLQRSKSNSHPEEEEEPIAVYDPLANYIPCMHTGCAIHYLSANLGPTFFFTQPPYRLRRKPGLCPKHAETDLRAANRTCKAVYERGRQQAGRKLMGEVQSEFDEFVRGLGEERGREGKELEELQRGIVLGGMGSREEKGAGSGEAKQGGLKRQMSLSGKRMSLHRSKSTKSLRSSSAPKSPGPPSPNPAVPKSPMTTTTTTTPPTPTQDQAPAPPSNRYLPRLCTHHMCPTPTATYTPFSAHDHPFYARSRNSGLRPHISLCPGCAKQEVEEAEAVVQAKREELDDEEFVYWLGDVKRERRAVCGEGERRQGGVGREGTDMETKGTGKDSVEKGREGKGKEKQGGETVRVPVPGELLEDRVEGKAALAEDKGGVMDSEDRKTGKKREACVVM